MRQRKVPVWGGGSTNGHKAEKDRRSRSLQGARRSRKREGRAIVADDARVRCPNPCWMACRWSGTRVDTTPVGVSGGGGRSFRPRVKASLMDGWTEGAFFVSIFVALWTNVRRLATCV